MIVQAASETSRKLSGTLPEMICVRDGVGKPGFSMAQPLVGAAGPPTGRGMGKPGFPIAQPPLGAAGAF